jgi:hypothetical protein
MIIPAGPGARDDLGRPSPATAYHATSKGGLSFSAPEPIEWEGQGQWIGNLLTADGQLVFFGSPGPTAAKLWKATSKDGVKWSKPVDVDLGSATGGPGMDPAVVRLENGSLFVVYTAAAGAKTPSGPAPGEDPGEEWPRRPGRPADLPR